MALTTPTTTSNTSAADALMQQNVTDFANANALLIQRQQQNILEAKAMEIAAEKANSYGKIKDKFSYS